MTITVTHTKALVAPATGIEDKVYGADYVDPASHTVALGADDNLVTDAEKTVIGNTSGTNTGDQSLSGLVNTANSPAANEFARFTDADTIEGRTVAEVKSDLGLGTIATQNTPLGVTVGGTGLTALTANRVPYATATDTLGTSANLTFDGTGNFDVAGSDAGMIRFTSGAQNKGWLRADSSGFHIRMLNGIDFSIRNPSDVTVANFSATTGTAVLTSLETPTINGGTAANDDITIQGTTHATRTTSFVNLQPSGGLVNVGTLGSAAGHPFAIGATGATLSGNVRVVSGHQDAAAAGKGVYLGYDNASQTGVIAGATNISASNLAYWLFSGSAWFETLRLKSNGSVLFGTEVDLSAKLSVYADSAAYSPTGFSAAQVRIGAANTNGHFSGFGFTNDGNREAFLGVVQVSSSTGDLVYQTYAGTYGERFRVTNAGNFGIATTAPDKILEVNLGTASAFRLTYNDANGGATTYMDTTVSSAGVTTFTGAGSAPTFSFAQAVAFGARIDIKSYTVGTVPAAGAAGGEIYVSDAAVAPCLAFSDGTVWKRCDNAATTVT